MTRYTLIAAGLCPQVSVYDNLQRGALRLDIHDQLYRTESVIGTSDIRLKRAESNIITDIGFVLDCRAIP